MNKSLQKTLLNPVLTTFSEALVAALSVPDNSHTSDAGLKTQVTIWCEQCCGSKYIEFGSGSQILVQFGSGSSVMLSILKEKIKNNFREKLFCLTKRYILRTKMSPLEIFSQLSHLIVNLYLKSHTFCLYFILFIHVWIRIRIPNKDPDPQSS